MDASKHFHLSAGGILQPGTARREYKVRFIRAGRVRQKGNTPSEIEIPAEAIRKALRDGLFEGRASFVDHAPDSRSPSLRNMVGISAAASWNEQAQAADGLIRLYQNPAAEALAALLDSMLADAEAGAPLPDIGLSLVFWPRWAPRAAGEPMRLAGFRHIESIDFVFEPGAGGQVLGRLAALPEGHAAAAGPELRPLPAIRRAPDEAAQGGELMTDTPNPNPSLPEGETAAAQPAPASPWLEALADAASQGIIRSSGLPEAARQRLERMRYRKPGEVNEAIQAEREYLASLYEDHVIQLTGGAPRGGRIQVGMDGLERLSLAADALVAGSRPPGDIPPLTGLRELYNLLSGDYEMTSMYRPERIQLANVTSATMAGLVANALNKRVVNLFQQYPRWWEPVVTEEDFSTLQDARWVTLGGVGELPTVAEGAAYTELTWDDSTEAAAFVKKGGYLGLTIEAIDKDDTRKLQAAPRALAQAAWLTLSKAVSSIFTLNSGVGPDLADGSPLFSAARGNLGETALSFEAYAAARLAMRKMVELNSGERLGALTSPRYLLVPQDLEVTAVQVLASELQPGGEGENPFAEGDFHDPRLNAARKRVIVVDLWTDANDWALAADPRLYPSIGLGYRYGRTPEIFSVASPTAGLMFTNDTMPIKVRFFFAVAPTDFRGLYKANVA